MTIDLVVFLILIISAILAWIMVKKAEMEPAMFFFLTIICVVLTLFCSVIGERFERGKNCRGLLKSRGRIKS